MSVGIFIGCLPLYGLHLPLCALVCLPLRLDLVTCYLAANISNPLFAPFLLIAEAELGSRILHGSSAALDNSLPLAETARRFALELAVGAPLVGVILGIGLGAFAFAVVDRRRPKDPRLAEAIRLTSERYARAPNKHRYYVRAKLRFDPLTALASDWTDLGRVVDLGCGRGQFTLLLLELGAASAVTGYDFDAEKIDVAKRAAEDLETADFHVSNIESVAEVRADSILMFDVLHYLSEAAQQRLLERAARSLPSSGRLFIREASPAARPSSALTRFAERIGRKLRVNRASEFRFVDPEDLRRTLEALGLTCELSDASDGTPLDNYLLVARRQGSESALRDEES